MEMEGLVDLLEESLLCKMENFPLSSMKSFNGDTLKTNLEDTKIVFVNGVFV